MHLFTSFFALFFSFGHAFSARPAVQPLMATAYSTSDSQTRQDLVRKEFASSYAEAAWVMSPRTNTTKLSYSAQ